MPVYIIHFTAWVDGKNNLNFRNDSYSLDKQLSKAILEENKICESYNFFKKLYNKLTV